MLMGVKRIYDKRDLTDGKRVFVERLWPRGVKKSTQGIDEWVKDVAPSTELRKWFAHDVAKWDEFKRKYDAELLANPKVDELIGAIRSSDITPGLLRRRHRAQQRGRAGRVHKEKALRAGSVIS